MTSTNLTRSSGARVHGGTRLAVTTARGNLTSAVTAHVKAGAYEIVEIDRVKQERIYGGTLLTLTTTDGRTVVGVRSRTPVFVEVAR